MKIAIVDDQEPERSALKAQLVKHFHRRRGKARAIDSYASGEALLPRAAWYDLIFLDILMPERDGMETARLLRAQGFRGALVFTTVIRDYVFDAFQVSAADYLIKPVNQERLTALLERLEAPAPDRLAVQEGNAVRLIDPRDVEYCEVLGRHLTLHRADGSTVRFRGRLQQLADAAGPAFFRCHRSYLVRLDAVAALSAGFAVTLHGDRVPVSRLRAKELREALLEHLAGDGTHDRSRLV